MKAAILEFAAKGYEGGSMRSIAREAGVQLGLLQHHFGDKNSLWSKVLTEVVREIRTQIEEIRVRHGKRDPATTLAKALEALMRYGAANSPFLAIMSHARTLPSQHALAYQQELGHSTRDLIELIKAAQAQGRFVPGDPVILFYQMVGAALRIFATAVDASSINDHRPTDSGVLEEHISTCIRLFMPPKSATFSSPPSKLETSGSVAKSSAPSSTKGPSAFYLLINVDSVVRRNLDEALRKTNITQSQMVALIRIANERKLSSAALARLLNVSAQSATVLVQALEQRGLIRRSQSTHSKRILAIDVTASGYKVLEKLRTVVGTAEHHLLEGLKPDERASLQGVLTRILTHHQPHALTDWSPLLPIE